MEFKGQRAVYITEDVSPFYAKAAKMIFNDLGIDFDKAVIDYADDECISLNIDGEEKTLYYEQTDDGFAYELVDTDEYDDLTTKYAGYDDEEDDSDDDFDPYSLTDDDMEGNFNNPYFQIAFSVVLTALDIDPNQHEIELLYYDEEDIGLVIDDRDAEIHIDLDSERPFVLEWMDEEEEDDSSPDNIISFSDYSSRE
ncbi:MAG: hypothetical protein IJ237_06200 [Oscillospiraceae bacterium]|nr:hypothetical protein [Oscillospiraceae bacterium]